MNTISFCKSQFLPQKTTVLFLLCILLVSGCTQKIALPTPPLSPNAEQIYLFLTFNQQKNEDPQKAINTLDKLLKLKPYPNLYLEKAVLLWQQKKHLLAKETLKEGCLKFPANQELNLTLMRQYLLENRQEAAKTTLENYLRFAPNDSEIRDDMAAFLLEQKKYADTVDLIKTVLPQKQSSRSRLIAGKAYLGLGNIAMAKKNLKQAVQLDPQNSIAQKELALFYESRKEYAEAEKIYTKLLKDNQQRNELLFHLIFLNLKLNDPDRALYFADKLQKDKPALLQAASAFIQYDFYKYAKNLLKYFPKNSTQTEVLYIRALIVANLENNPDKALKYLQKINPETKNYEPIILFQIHLLKEKKEWNKANELCQKGQKKYPKNPIFSLVLADLYAQTNNEQQALLILRQAEKTWPKHTDILFSLGSILYRQQKIQESIDYMEKIIAENPNHASALNFLGYTLAEQNHNLERAITLIKRAVQKEPRNGHFLDSLAWAYFKQGDTQKAWEIIQESVEQVDHEYEIWEHYAKIAQKLNKNKEMQKAYKQMRILKKYSNLN